MSEKTSIAWCHATFNPWWGCEKVSPACTNCYAEAFAKRTGHDIWGHGSARRFFGDKHWAEPLKWNKAAMEAGERRRVFCASMADVFEDRRDLDTHRDRLWELIKVTPHLDWLLLTKRPKNVSLFLPLSCARRMWPDNVWLGTTVENQSQAELRIPHLLETGARVLFLSCEPLLGPIKIQDWGIHWVIAGGESGPGHRMMDLGWAHALRADCLTRNISFFFKQTSGPRPGMNPDALGKFYQEFPR